MTPSASASPIVLLAPTAAPAAAAASAEIAPAAALDGGFQLLVDAASQQQLAAQLAGNAAKAPTVPLGEGGDPAATAGNVLPLPGLNLPVDDGVPADGAPALKKADDTDEGDAALPATASATPPPATIPVPWVPVNIQQPQQPAAKAPGSKVAADADVAIDTTLATGTAPAAANSSASASAQPGLAAEGAAPDTVDGIQLGAAGMSVPAPATRQPGTERTAQPSTDVLVGTSADAAKSASTGDAAGARKGDIASFADALKPAVAAAADAAQPQVPAAGAVDAGRAHAPTRSYADIGAANTTATVSVPVGSTGWSDAVVDKVMWFSANQINSAEIKLNPPDLGPLQVRISTQHDQTSVVFSSPHAAVRDALDQALPRLRDMFGGQGLQLSDASVGGQAQRQQQQAGDNGASGQNRNSTWFGSEDNGDTPVAVTRVAGPRLATSAVDAYA